MKGTSILIKPVSSTCNMACHYCFYRDEAEKRQQEIYEDYRSRGWKYQQYIACLDPLGEVHGKRGYALTPEAYGEFLIRLFQLWYEDVKKRKQPFIRQFENYIALAMGYRAEACSQRGNCGLQNVVEADGSVFPCDFYALDKYRLGNLNEDRMETIEERYRDYDPVSGTYKSYFCKSCQMFFDACYEKIVETGKEAGRWQRVRK